MSGPDISPAGIAKALEGVTDGPWAWEVNQKNKRVELTGGKQTQAGGDLTVMAFCRYGMQGAQPVFFRWKGNVAVQIADASSLAVAAAGREHHRQWFARIDHPDANFIAWAREAVPAMAARIADLKAQLAAALTPTLGDALGLDTPPSESDHIATMISDLSHTGDLSMLYRMEIAGALTSLSAALGSIARNTCCDGCREAALVARAALTGGAECE